MIGIFDSGFGGLATLHFLQKILPEKNYIFFGDTINSPFGNRSQEKIYEFTKFGVNFLFSHGAKIVLIACNTASCVALRKLQIENPSKKILGVLIPAAEEALEKSRFGKIGVIGTRATIKSKKFNYEIEKLYPKIYQPKDRRAQKIPLVFSEAAPLLVPLVEENWISRPETTMILKKYIHNLRDANVDTLILGCTHYHFLKKIFARKMGKRCQIINSAETQAYRFLDYLKKHPEISENLSNGGKTKFFTSGETEKFLKIGSIFLKKKIAKNAIEKIIN